MNSVLGTLETIPATDWDDLLKVDEYEKGHEYLFEVTYLDDHKEIGRLRYNGPHRNPYPVPGTNEHLTIPEFITLKPEVSLGYAKSIRRIYG